MSRKRSATANGDGLLALGRDRTLEDSMGQQLAPTLFQLLNPAFKDDKCVRMGARLTLKVLGGYYVVTVACPSEMCQTTVVALSLANLVEQLETSLSSGSTVWLPDFEAQKRDRQAAKR